MTEPRTHPEYDGARVRFGRLVRGYGQALSRFQLAAMDRDPEPAFYALFEALNWATAIDEFVAEVWRPAGDREGFDWRGRVEGAEVLDGIRFVRNRVHHQWADALRVEEGARLPARLPFAFFSWLWRDVDELPAPDPRRPDERGRAVYVNRLANQRAAYTLTDLTAPFARVTSLLEPPSPRPSGEAA